MNRNEKLAYDYVEIAQKLYESGNNMAYIALLKGTGTAKMETKPGEGHNVIMVIDGIHEFQNDNPKRPVKEAYEYSIKRLSTLIYSQREAMEFINIIAYELKYERDHKESFKIDMNSIFSILSETINKNRADIMTDGNNPNFEQWLNNQNDYLSTNFGRSF